jgi:FkbM family methyltransferase
LSSNAINVSKNGINFTVTSNPMTRWIWDEMHNNNWEEATFKIFDRFLNAENPYLDIGAWIGPTVLYGAHKAKHVYGVEPDPIAFAELVVNLDLNPFIASKITCINAALAEKSGSINLYMRNRFGDSTSSLIPTLSDNNFCQIRAVSIHDLITEHNIEKLNFIKMDIEGGEYFLIPCLHEFLESQKPTLYLSLHPGFLGEHINLMANQNGVSSEQPNTQTERLLDNLQCYKYIYDISGKPVTRDAVLSVLYTGEFIFTDECW